MEPTPALAKLAAAKPPHWRWQGADCIHGLTWAAHGHTLLVATLAGELACLEGATGKPRWHVPNAHPGGALWISPHPTESLVASGGQDGAVRLWDANTGTAKAMLFQNKKQWVELGAWSADGALLAVAAGKEVTFWSPSGEARGALPPQKTTVSALAWHPRESQLLIGCYGSVAVWKHDASTPLSAKTFPTSLLAAAWQPGDEASPGVWAALGTGDASIEVWHVGTDESLRMSGYASKVRELAWNCDGTHLFTGGGFNGICWSFQGAGPEGSTPQEWMGHSEFITAIAAHPTDPGRAATIGRDQLLFLWKLGSDDPTALRAIPESVPNLLAWKPDGSALVAGCEGGEVLLFKIT